VAAVTTSTLRSGSVRNQILDAAEQLMAERGFSATSVAEVCARSKLPVGSIYWHFKSKDGLLAAVMERGNERFFASLPDPAALPGSPREQFDAWFAANTATLSDRPLFLRLHLNLCLLDGTEETVADIVRRVRRTATTQIEHALRPWVAEFQPHQADQLTQQLAAYMLAVVDGSFIAQHVDNARIKPLLDQLHRFLCATVESGHQNIV